jgi:tRNA-2-methylthio-N6-dimethylallyladenosine synthase
MSFNEIKKNKVYLVTFGCQMNEADTELVRSILFDAGYVFTEDELAADIVMLNTCSVRENAHRKVYGSIHELRHHRKGNMPLIGILGCMATGLRDELLNNKALDLDFVVGPDSYRRLPVMLKEVQEGRDRGYDVTLSDLETYADVHPVRTRGVNAWIPVMRGCDNFCSFCIVPYTRGRERSRSVESIVEEAGRLASEGFTQVTLLGQNINSYLDAGRDFAALLETVSAVREIRRIRFTSPHPKDFPQRLITTIADNPRVCKQVHLPLQSGSDRILDLMNRGYTVRDFLALVARLREVCPSIALTTDVIVGFPTETDSDFEKTLRVMREVGFDAAFMFNYSSRPHTLAAEKFPDDVPETVKTSRIVRLNELQKDISFRRNKALVGQVQEILIEEIGRVKGGKPFGRNDANKIVTLPPGAYQPGQYVNVRIIRATPHQLKGELNSPAN